MPHVQPQNMHLRFMQGSIGGDWVAAYDANEAAPVVLHPSSVMMVSNREAAIAFAREGIGFALVTELSVRDDLKAGRLVRVLPDMTFGGITMQTVMRDRLPSPEARAFREFLSGPED